jgi:hypothetical protein
MIQLAAGPDGRFPSLHWKRRGCGERKVRTPQSGVPDNVREGGFKSVRRKVPQRIYRPHFRMRVRVKRCGKSAPPRQQCSGQGKPHTEQDQIGRKPGLGSHESRFGHVPARCVKPSGRSLEPRSDAWPRGMTVPLEQSGGQNSAYRSGCHKFFQFDFRSTPNVSTQPPAGDSPAPRTSA